MKILALDIATKVGWAVFDNKALTNFDTLFSDRKASDFGEYPRNYILWAEYIADRIMELVSKFDPSVVVIEETNASRQNYSQKILEHVHFAVNKRLMEYPNIQVKYIRTGVWRKLTGSVQTKEEKALNAKIARIKKKTGDKIAKIDGKRVGKFTRKHSALRCFEDHFGIKLPKKLDDAAEAALLGLSYIKGAPTCDGTLMGGNLR